MSLPLDTGASSLAPSLDLHHGHTATAPSHASSVHDEKIDEKISDRQDTRAPSSGEPSYPTGFAFWLVFSSVIASVVLLAIDQTIVSTAIPALSNEFRTFSDIGWYGSAYLLTSTCFQPLFGRLYSRFSIKYTFLTAFTLFEIGSLICAVAHDSTTFIVGRAIAGLGMSGAYSGTMIIVTLISPVERRPVMMSVVGGSYGLGACVGPIVGGALTSGTTWRWCFWINLCFYPLVATAIVFFLTIPRQGGVQKESAWRRFVWIDWPGVVLSLTAMICLLLALQWGGVRYAWSDSKVVGLIVGFVAISAAFAAEQWFLGDDAIIPFRLHRQRTVGFGSAVNFAIAASYFGLLYFIPLYFQTVRGSSAIRSGVQTLPFVIAVIVANAVSGTLITAYGYYIPILIVGAALTSVGSGLLYLLRPESSLSLYVGLQFLAGIGPGLAFMIPFSAVSARLEPEDIEIGSAIVTFWQTLGGTVFVSVCQAIFQNDFIRQLRTNVPGAPVDEIVSHGVSAFRAFTPKELLGDVELAANLAVNKTFLCSVALGGVALACVFGMELSRRILPVEKQLAQAQKESEQGKA
ncbi:probable aflatoxin efflux pump AFLT [Sporisorium reilianum SRZ2]|uniref:Probable aflatoxin efflux pump AFLT n=1 Tax=Sporisorium reilianum (strain SRZ2) TaxID=999809 RepID=E6ZSJ2_SPORE|nr:probable aflatoxin efflux pump AFLT [Sporisorium reilianum SRZ2]